MLETLKLSEIAELIPGAVLKNGDASFSSLSTDSRTVCSGDVYIALKGDSFDGHNFISQVAEKSAAGCIVSSEPAGISIPVLLVPDTLQALACIANICRQKFRGRLIGLTGSAGKTSCKEMLASIFGCAGDVTATRANLNNNFGVPYTLLEMEHSGGFAVIEMGTNAPGEIRFSAVCAEPDIALILNASEAHLQGFGSLEAIRQEKGDLLEGLRQGGIAVLNADDTAFPVWKKRALSRQAEVISFGMKSTAADVTALNLKGDSSGCFSFELRTGKGSAPVTLQVAGRHQVMNALAVTATALSAGIALKTIVNALGKFSGVQRRLQVLSGVRGSVIYNDTYNASPASVYAGLDLLADLPGRTIAVIADMAELGEDSLSLHRAIYNYADRKADLVFLYGPEFAQLKGVSVHTSKAQLIGHLQNTLRRDDKVLVKGANCMKMQEVVDALTQGVSA